MSSSSAPDAFPSLLVGPDRLEPRGAFAEAQARYLNPDPWSVRELERLLRDKNVGVVAHCYMDPELQGVLSACDWPHIHVADSLEMAGRAVEMAQAGVEALAVLGVDFMSENARALIDAAGFAHLPVYRMSERPIGCSLADAARSREYEAFLTEASRTPRSLHIIYVNTGLDTKAKAHRLVPTITCTSSNVVQMVLQAAAQVPDLHIWYGPDTHMGENLQHLFTSLLDMPEAAIRDLHSGHDRKSLRSLVDRFRYFGQGVCIVHHMFDGQIAQRVRSEYGDALITAHLEVPGEMFQCALEAQRRGAGVVGSTANIQAFVTAKLEAAAVAGERSCLRFVLGTESGMVTPLVLRTQGVLRKRVAASGSALSAEIIFPVAPEAIAPTDDAQLKVVPGAAAGEGCSAAGGCATCPYMKMNSLEALFGVLERIDGQRREALSGFEPEKHGALLDGRSLAALGTESILHMRAYQQTGSLPEKLVEDIKGRH